MRVGVLGAQERLGFADAETEHVAVVLNALHAGGQHSANGEIGSLNAAVHLGRHQAHLDALVPRGRAVKADDDALYKLADGKVRIESGHIRPTRGSLVVAVGVLGSRVIFGGSLNKRRKLGRNFSDGAVAGKTMGKRDGKIKLANFLDGAKEREADVKALELENGGGERLLLARLLGGNHLLLLALALLGGRGLGGGSSLLRLRVVANQRSLRANVRKMGKLCTKALVHHP